MRKRTFAFRYKLCIAYLQFGNNKETHSETESSADLQIIGKFRCIRYVAAVLRRDPKAITSITW